MGAGAAAVVPRKQAGANPPTLPVPWARAAARSCMP